MTFVEGKVKIEKFDGSDFGFWKMQIEDYLYHKKLYLPLKGEKPDNMEQSDWELLVNLKMDEGNFGTHHISEFNTIIAQMASMQITLDDEIKALVLLSSLPESWSAIVTIGSNSTSNSKLKFDNILDLILSEDVRRRSLVESSQSNSGSALSVENRGRNSQKGRNQGRDTSKSIGRSQTKVRNDITCWNCQKSGHFKNQCRTSRKNSNKKKQDNNQSTDAATDDSLDALLCSLESNMDSWIMELGASFYTTPSLELLCKYVSEKFGKIYLAGEDICGKR
ncbi:hypothetical protein V8G54_037808 [Vigna mungo]|uniref:CCHC-type domain-containing protein n=1 Tax=Vigna mungo TaxID=3915 RepID=A0AAQ3ML05_VIGMU